MEARAPHWRSAVLPLSFASVCVVLLIATWIAFGGSVPFAPQQYRFYMPLPAASNIYEDTSVRMAGITIGKVVTVQRAGDHARVLVQLAPQYAPLRAGARAIVRSKTLLGEGYLELAPGPASAPALRDGATLSAAQVTPNQQLFDVLRIFTPQARSELRSMFDGLSAALAHRTSSLNGALGYAGPAVTSFNSVLGELQSQEPQLASLISSSGTVLSALGGRVGVIQSLIRSGDAALATTAAADRGLAATITRLPGFLRQVQASSQVLSGAAGPIGAAVNGLQRVSGPLPGAERSIYAATPVFTALFRGLPAVLSVGQRALPELDRVLGSAGAALPAVYDAARQLIPLFQLLSADQSSVVGSLANAAQIQNGVMNAPGLGAIHYAAGALTVWNETVGGWLRKLPTNRSNPYPAPDSENNIASGGLHAYDCRNTGNPLILPPTGTGAPACKPQGPWVFDGKSAYYPRLQQAPP